MNPETEPSRLLYVLFWFVNFHFTHPYFAYFRMYCYGCFKCWFSNTNVYYQSRNFANHVFTGKVFAKFITWCKLVKFHHKWSFCLWEMELNTAGKLLTSDNDARLRHQGSSCLLKKLQQKEYSELHFLREWKKDSILLFQPICSSGDRNTSFKVNASSLPVSVLPTFWNGVNSERKQVALAGANSSF